MRMMKLPFKNARQTDFMSIESVAKEPNKKTNATDMDKEPKKKLRGYAFAKTPAFDPVSRICKKAIVFDTPQNKNIASDSAFFCVGDFFGAGVAIFLFSYASRSDMIPRSHSRREIGAF